MYSIDHKWQFFPALLSFSLRSRHCQKFECRKSTCRSMSTTLPLFWDLSSADKKRRLNASVKLISTLEKFQASYEHKSAESDPSSNGEDSSGEEDVQATGTVGNMEHDNMLDSLNVPDVAYSVRRLVRGLASPRESSRLGFAVALTEVRAMLQCHLSLMIKFLQVAFPYHNGFLRTTFGTPPRCHSHFR